MNYLEQVKIILQKSALRENAVYGIKSSFPVHTRMEITNELVVCYFHYSDVLLSGINRSLPISSKKELKWAVKSSLNSKNYDTSHDLQSQYAKLPFQHLLRIEAAPYLQKVWLIEPQFS